MVGVVVLFVRLLLVGMRLRFFARRRHQITAVAATTTT